MQKRLNILLILTFNSSLLDWEKSGVIDREMAVYKNLTETKHLNYTFLTFGDNSEFSIKYNAFEFKIIPVYKYIKKTKFKSLNLIKSLFFSLSLRKYCDNISIIKTNQLMGSWMGFISKYILKAKLIVRTGYDIYNFSKLDQKKFYKRLFYFILTQFALFFSNLYTVSNNSDKDNLNKNFITKYSKIEVIANFVILDNNRVNFLDRSDNKILAVGRLENQKNFDELIKCFANKPFEITIVGSGSKELELKEMAAKLNVNVKFLGNISNFDLLNLYNKYRYYISTSNYEGNSKTILEAMSRGCIVICKNIKNNSELIKNQLNGFLYNNVLDYETFESIQKKPLNNLELISSNAVKEIEKKYSLNILSEFEYQNYIKLYL